MEERGRGLATIVWLRQRLQILAVVSLLFAMTGATMFVATPTVNAATCGGNIVSKVSGNLVSWEHIIFVDFGKNRSRGTITRIEFNGQVVANSDNGVLYNTTIAQSDSHTFGYGVSKRWIFLENHLSWADTWRWRVFYNC